MIGIYDLLSVLSVLSCVGVMGAKIYNLMSLHEYYNHRIAWMLFGGALLAWGIGLLPVLFDPEMLVYLSLYSVSTFALRVTVMVTVLEVLMMMAGSVRAPLQRFNSMDSRRSTKEYKLRPLEWR